MNEFNIRVCRENNEGWIATGIGLEKHGVASTPIHAILDLLMQYYIYFLFLDNKENLNKYEKSQFNKLRSLKIDEFKNSELLSSLFLNKLAEYDDFDYLSSLQTIYSLSPEEITKMYWRATKRLRAYLKISEGFHDLTNAKTDGTPFVVDYEMRQYLKYNEYARKYGQIVQFIEDEKTWQEFVQEYMNGKDDNNKEQRQDK